MTHTVYLKTDVQREFAKSLVDRAPPNYVIRISEPTRTGEQNDKMWAVMTDISRSKPNGRRATPETWKNLMMHACGHSVQFEEGLNGLPFPVGFRSSRLNVRQMSELIEFAQAWGSDNGVKWSDL